MSSDDEEGQRTWDAFLSEARPYTWDILSAVCKSLQETPAPAFTLEALKKGRNVAKKRNGNGRNSNNNKKKKKLEGDPDPDPDYGAADPDCGSDPDVEADPDCGSDPDVEIAGASEYVKKLAKDDLLRSWRTYTWKEFQEDVQTIHSCLPTAKQEVNLYEAHIAKPGLIKHDSKVPDVIKKIPLSDFPLVKKGIVEGLISRKIDLEKGWRKLRRRAELVESLPSRSCLKSQDFRWGTCLELLKGEKDYEDFVSFVKDPHSLEFDIYLYHDFMEKHSYLGIDEANVEYLSSIRRRFKRQEEEHTEGWEAKPNRFALTFYFLAKHEPEPEPQEYESIDDLLKMLKFRAYFDYLR